MVESLPKLLEIPKVKFSVTLNKDKNQKIIIIKKLSLERIFKMSLLLLVTLCLMAPRFDFFRCCFYSCVGCVC